MYTAEELLIKQHTRTMLALIAAYSRLKNPMGGQHAYECGMLSTTVAELALCKEEHRIAYLERQISWLTECVSAMQTVYPRPTI